MLPETDGVPVTLVLSVDVDAPAQATWDAAVDWSTQGEWMLGTTVRPTHLDGRGVGARIEAYTGRVVRGTGAFEVEPRGDARSRFLWREDLDLPLGLLGRVGWPLVRPFFAYGVQLSLRRFARSVEARAAAVSGR